MYDKVVKGPWGYRLLALFFAVMLFFIANSRNLSQPLTTTRSYESNLENVSIEFNYDAEKYYISGYQTTAKVRLKSTNKVLLDAETNEQTRSFKVVANLTSYQEGTVEVKLKVENLKSGVTAKIEPKTIPVTIEKRKTATFKVEPSLDTNLLDKGYKLSSLTTEPEEVEVTTGDKTLKDIARVIAIVNVNSTITESFSDTVTLQALDKDGNSLDVSFEPTQVKVNAEVAAPTKTVKLHVTQTGKTPSGIQYYSFALSQDSIEITGSQTVLDEITQIEIPVNVSGIRDAITQSYKLSLPQGVKATTDSVKVTVTPTWSVVDSSSSSSSAANQETNSSAVKSSQSETDTSSEENDNNDSSSNQ